MNKHLIIVRYVGPTNFRSSRISLQSARSAADRIFIPYEHESLHLSEIAGSWLKAHGYTIHCTCEMPEGAGILVNEFTLLSVAKSQ